MKENLKTTHYASGTAIPLVTDSTAWANLGYPDRAYYDYDNSALNDAIYGALYTWAGAMNGAESSSANPSGVQGVCPNGWHLPSDNEWIQMEIFLGMTQTQAGAPGFRGTDQGGQLKATTLWNSPNTGATNSSGFTALPSGYRSSNGSFLYLGSNGFWWAATEFSSSDAWSRYLSYGNAQVYRGNVYKDYGRSVRCVRDN